MERGKGRENPVKIVRWEDGTLQCFHGSMDEITEKAEKLQKENNMKFVIV